MRQVSATELAKLGKCERQMYLDYHHGEDHTLTAKFIQHGNIEHDEFNRRLSGQATRGLIATILFGIMSIGKRLFRWAIRVGRR